MKKTFKSWCPNRDDESEAVDMGTGDGTSLNAAERFAEFKCDLDCCWFDVFEQGAEVCVRASDGSLLSYIVKARREIRFSIAFAGRKERSEHVD